MEESLYYTANPLTRAWPLPSLPFLLHRLPGEETLAKSGAVEGDRRSSKQNNKKLSPVQWLTSVISVLGRLRQDDYHKGNASLSYRVSSPLAWIQCVQPCLKHEGYGDGSVVKSTGGFSSQLPQSGSQGSLLQFPRDLKPSSDLHEHQACMWYTYIHTAMQKKLKHIKNVFKFKKEIRKQNKKMEKFWALFRTWTKPSQNWKLNALHHPHPHWNWLNFNPEVLDIVSPLSQPVGGSDPHEVGVFEEKKLVSLLGFRLHGCKTAPHFEFD